MQIKKFHPAETIPTPKPEHSMVRVGCFYCEWQGQSIDEDGGRHLARVHERIHLEGETPVVRKSSTR